MNYVRETSYKKEFFCSIGVNRALIRQITPRAGFEPALSQRRNGFRDRRLTTRLPGHFLKYV
jgi:hypothetical protein